MADSNDVQQLIQVLTVRLDRQGEQQDLTNDLLARMLTQQQHFDGRLDRQEKQQDLTNDLLARMLTQQEALFQLQQSFQKSQEGFNARQEKFNERQDQFNIIFLDEIRDIKHDVRDLKKDIGILKDVTLKQHDERLKRLEDFMDGLLRKAS